MEENEKAVAAAQATVRDKPNSAQSYVDLGMAYFHAERFDDAVSAFQEALAVNPNTATAYNGLGRVLYHIGPPQAAIDAYQHAIDLDPHYVDAYYGLGILNSAQLGEYEAAIKAFETGIEHNPTESFLIASLGSTYARMGLFEKAIRTLRQSIDLQPNNAFAYSWLSMIYLHLGRYEDAIIACQHEIEIEDNYSAHRVLGYTYERLGWFDESISQLEYAIKLEPEDYEARGALSRLYRVLGRGPEAEEQYSLASKMASQDDEYGQACLEAVRTNTEQALKLLATALDKGQVQRGWVRIDPEFVFLKEDLGFQLLIQE